MPKNIEGVKADPPTIFFSSKPAVLVNLDGDPIWSPIKEQRPQVRGQHELGSLPARAHEGLLPAPRAELAPGRGPEGPVDGGGQAAGELQEASRRRQLEGRQGRAAGQEARPRQAAAAGVRQHHAGRDDPADRRAEVRAGGRHIACSGSATPRATCSGWGRRARSTTWWPGAGSRRPTSPGPGRSPRPSCRRTSRRSRSSIPRSRVLASVPGTQQAAEAVLLAQVPQTARVNKKQ